MILSAMALFARYEDTPRKIAETVARQVGQPASARSIALPSRGRSAGLDSAERAIAAVYRSAMHLSLMGSLPDAFPGRSPDAAQKGSSIIRRAFKPASGQRAALFLAHALSHYGWRVAGSEQQSNQFAALAADLQAALPLPSDDAAAVGGCADLGNAQDGDMSRVPAPFWTGLMLARQAGEPPSAADIATHQEMSRLYFICEAQARAVELVVGRQVYAEVANDLVHVDVFRFDPVRARAAEISWTQSMNELLPLAEAST